MKHQNQVSVDREMNTLLKVLCVSLLFGAGMTGSAWAQSTVDVPRHMLPIKTACTHNSERGCVSREATKVCRKLGYGSRQEVWADAKNGETYIHIRRLACWLK